MEALVSEPALFQIVHILEDCIVFPHKHHFQEVADLKWRNENFLALMCGSRLSTRKAIWGFSLTARGTVVSGS
jgi:hypothetical protein